MAKNFYEVLGVDENATTQQVRERFKQIARLQHPDRFRGAEKVEAEVRFQDLTEAFNGLVDADRRRQHDIELKRPEGATEANKAEVAKVYLQRGLEAYGQKKFLDAVENLGRATTEDPQNSTAWYHLAKTYRHQNRWMGKATEAIARAIHLEPMNADFLKLGGQLFAKAGDSQKATEYYQEALNWSGEDDEIRSALAELKKADKGGGFFGRIVG